jgi:tellurite resistance protein TerC
MIWWFFLLLIAALLFLDLGVLHRKARDLSLYESVALSIFWITLGLSFAVVIYFVYEHHWFSDSINLSIDSKTAVTQYLTAYLVEESLSLDNLFVIALIFQTLKIPVGYQHRVLLLGIMGAIVMRGVIIVLGVFLANEISWMNYVFGAILLFSAIKLLIDSQQPEMHPQQGTILRIAKHIFPYTDNIANSNFFTRIEGKLTMTPLFIAVLMVETADLLFAVDSIPAVIGISRDPFIIFSSNIFAILGLRAIYFLLAAAITKLRYLKATLILILGFISIKMLIAHHYEISATTSLIVICTFLLLGVLTSLIIKHEPLVSGSPIGKARLNTLYEFTFASLRRSIILLVGTTVVIIGIIMLVTPGPAIVVIPLGLAILATEFVWARRLLSKFKEKFVHYRKETRTLFRREGQPSAPKADHNHSNKDQP